MWSKVWDSHYLSIRSTCVLFNPCVKFGVTVLGSPVGSELHITSTSESVSQSGEPLCSVLSCLEGPQSDFLLLLQCPATQLNHLACMVIPVLFQPSALFSDSMTCNTNTSERSLECRPWMTITDNKQVCWSSLVFWDVDIAADLTHCLHCCVDALIRELLCRFHFLQHPVQRLLLQWYDLWLY